MEEGTAAQDRDEEEQGENQFEGPDSRLHCARGGPIFGPDLVGPLSSVPDFKASVLRELDCLHSDLRDCPSFDLDLSYDPHSLFFSSSLLSSHSDKIH
jgi:hypothetical protein